MNIVALKCKDCGTYHDELVNGLCFSCEANEIEVIQVPTCHCRKCFTETEHLDANGVCTDCEPKELSFEHSDDCQCIRCFDPHEYYDLFELGLLR